MYYFLCTNQKYHGNDKNTQKEHDNGTKAKKQHDNGKTTKKQKGHGKKAKKPKATTYRLKFINSYRFMQCSLSTLVDNLSSNDKTSQASLIEKFPNTYRLCNKEHNKFDLLLRKGVYRYEYMESWKRFKEESFPDKEYFYNERNNEHITDEDYEHAQKVWCTFNIKHLDEYHDLYVQSDTTLLADVFESFKDKCTEIYDLDPAHFLSAPGLAW